MGKTADLDSQGGSAGDIFGGHPTKGWHLMGRGQDAANTL